MQKFMKFTLEALSLKLRLNLLITALLALMLVIGAMQLIINARENVRAEVESTSVLVKHLLDAEIAYLATGANTLTLEHPFRLEDFRHIRHFRIEYYDAQGRLRDSNQSPISGAYASKDTPQWFAALMERVDLNWAAARRQVTVNGHDIGQLIITPDPSYEIAEVWDDTMGLLMLVILFFVTVNIMVYWAVSRALRPVDNVWAALNELERGNLEARLPMFELPELARISEKFNRMANTLQQSISSNHKLSQQLIRLQEEERKSLARDLHDELGQSLTAIRVDGSTLLEMSRTDFPAARESAQAIVDVTHHVIHQIRAMLQRLRPEVLDGLGLRAALNEMLSSWRQRNNSVTCIIKLSDAIDSMDETANITAYRVVQESLTNIARHAAARRVEVSVRRLLGGSDGCMLEIMVADDGKGFDAENLQGFGLSGMRERVEGMGGTFELTSVSSQGTRILVSIPIKETV